MGEVIVHQTDEISVGDFCTQFQYQPKQVRWVSIRHRYEVTDNDDPAPIKICECDGTVMASCTIQEFEELIRKMLTFSDEVSRIQATPPVSDDTAKAQDELYPGHGIVDASKVEPDVPYFEQ